MAITFDDYKKQLFRLIPYGFAWIREEGTSADGLHEQAAKEPSRVHNRTIDLLNEADPRTTIEMLEDWEYNYGLPEACTTQPETYQERINALVTKVNRIGGQSPQYYIDRAAELGYTITITEPMAFRAGISAVGDPLYGSSWESTWIVNAPLYSIEYFRTGYSSAGDPLAKWGNDQLECLINRLKPAHTKVLFSYT